MVGGMLGLFAAAGLIMWFGSRISTAATAVVALGWPLLFVSLGWNFLDYGLPPARWRAGPVWGWLIPGDPVLGHGRRPGRGRDRRLARGAGRPPRQPDVAAGREPAPAGRRLGPSSDRRPAGDADRPERPAERPGRDFASSAFAPVYSSAGRIGLGRREPPAPRSTSPAISSGCPASTRSATSRTRSSPGPRPTCSRRAEPAR